MSQVSGGAVLTGAEVCGVANPPDETSHDSDPENRIHSSFNEKFIKTEGVLGLEACDKYETLIKIMNGRRARGRETYLGRGIK